MRKIIVTLLLGYCVSAQAYFFDDHVLVHDEWMKQDFNIGVMVLKQNSPAPTIIALHTCFGLDPHEIGWAQLYQSYGYNVVLPDSFTERNLSHECVNGMYGGAWTRTYDIEYVSAWIKKQTWHKGKVGVIGWSHGATTINVFGPTKRAQQSVDAMVSYYGECLSRRQKTPLINPLVPVQMHLGAKDDWTLPGPCIALKEQNNPNYDINSYPDAYHSFDIPVPFRIKWGGHALAWDEYAANQSAIKTKEFFDKHLKN